MSDVELLEMAVKLAFTAHQEVKPGYITHPVYLALQMDTLDEKMAALLHDVVEDTEYTTDHLQKLGFPAAVVAAVEICTRRAGERYHADYIVRVRDAEGEAGRIARKIKRADLCHNSSPARMTYWTDEETRNGMLRRYRRAMEMLQNAD